MKFLDSILRSSRLYNLKGGFRTYRFNNASPAPARIGSPLKIGSFEKSRDFRGSADHGDFSCSSQTDRTCRVWENEYDWRYGEPELRRTSLPSENYRETCSPLRQSLEYPPNDKRDKRRSRMEYKLTIKYPGII